MTGTSLEAMPHEERTRISVERVVLTSERSFDEVLAGVSESISRPELASAARAWLGATTYEEFEEAVAKAAGPAGLLEFLRLDQGAALSKVPGVTPFRQVRILAGNPLTMTKMTRHVPEAGATVPISILIWEDRGTVRIAYDTMESLLAPYANAEASDVARRLDEKVLSLLRGAAG